jgi:hypothetical protein
MRKFCNVKTTVLCGLLAAGLIVASSARQANARQPYYKMWLQMYPMDAKANNFAKELKCNVCHVGMKKADRNAYGKAIAKALGGKKNLKASQKTDIEAAIKKAESAKSETEGKTFGDLLQDNQLPSPAK